MSSRLLEALKEIKRIRDEIDRIDNEVAELLESLTRGFTVPIYEFVVARFFEIPIPQHVELCQVVKSDVDDERFELAIGLPGVSKEDVKITYYPDRGVLKIRGFRKYDGREINCVFTIPNDVKPESVKAFMKDGLLVLTGERSIRKYEIKIE